MAALLHDLAHLPYGHTLENELGILKEHHDSADERVPRFFDRLKDEIEADTAENRERLISLIEYARMTMRTISHINNEIGEGKPSPSNGTLPLNQWFVADIIGNTICADLLDYTRRDMRATGLNQDYDDRLYSYFDLAPDQEHRVRLALRTTKAQGLRLDAVSEILHVLRIRYTLSERVLFHHTKNVASAILGEALSYIDFGPEAFDEMRDEELLPWIRDQAQAEGLDQDTAQAVNRLVDALESRHLHKIIMRVGHDQQHGYQTKNAQHLGDAFSQVKARKELQEEIRAHFPQLRNGDIIIYCPPRQMTMKEIWVNVLARKDEMKCRPLRKEEAPYLPEVVLQEIQALEHKYTALWSWTVMVAPEKLDYAFAVQEFIRQKLDISNDPFVHSYWEGQLEIGREVMKRAPGEYHVQARAVEIGLAEEEELQRAAAAGPPDHRAYFDDVVRRARDELYPRPQALP